MNPCTWVAGGGGAGGGGAGGNGKGGDGKGGAGGGKGENDPNDGGKSAGACGAGGNGACTNCGHNVSAGDPVDVISGKTFTVPKTDLYLPGTFNLSLLRYYTTGFCDEDIGIGYGWRYSLGWTLEERQRTVVVCTGDGRRMEFEAPPKPAGAMEVGGWALMRGEGFYAVRPGNEFVHLFEPVPNKDGWYRLARVLFRNRGHISLQYERGRLARIVDTVGRVILLDPAPGGQIAAVRVTEPKTGRTIVFARYAYDDDRNLIAAADADGHVTRYAYDDHHRLTRLEYPSGVTFHYLYDARGRCVQTWGDRADGPDPALAADLPTLLSDGETRARGIHHCKLDFVDDEYTEVSDSIRLRRFMAGPDARVAKAVGARGGVTTRTFDEHGRVISQTDPTEATWKYQYDDQDKLVRETDPEGHDVAITRDGAGREMEIVDPAGGVTKFGRDQYGEITWMRDPADGYIEFKLTNEGRVTEMLDPRGGRHLLTYDDLGNITSRVFPNGSRLTFEYDYWGRIVAETQPDGARSTWTWNDSGLPTSFCNPLGHTRRWEWDEMGNLAAEIEPDGSATRFHYGGLNWLYCASLPDGSERRGWYNREGWLVRYANERGETTEFEHYPDGFISREVMFHGEQLRYGYDALGRLLWFDDGLGKRELTRSPAGRVLKEEGPNGALREYDYDARGELIRATWGDVSFEWARDPLGRLLREVLNIEGSSYVTDSVRNEAGDRLAYKTSLGLSLDVRRDANGQVRELWGGEGRVLGIERNANGRPVRWEFGRGGAVLDTYDAASRLIRREAVGPGDGAPLTEEPEWVGVAGPFAAGIALDYTPIDEIRSVTEFDGSLVEYEYDARRHVRKRTVNGVDEEWRADATSNYYEVGPNASPRRYERGNVLVALGENSYRYDARGYLIEKRRQVPGRDAPLVTTYEWNDFNLLDAVVNPDGTRVEFKYDPFARRLAKRVLRDGVVIDHHHYVWDTLSLVHDVKVDVNGAVGELQTYLFEENNQVIPLGQRAANGWLHYIHDANGSPVQIVDDRGQSLSRLQSSLFGRTLTRGSISTPFRLPGQWDDGETGLHYNRYRYYDPEAGRFISPDPIGLNGSINLYSLGPNPVGWSDPMGWQHMMTVTSNTGPGGAHQPWGGPSGLDAPANQVVGQPGQYQSGLQGDGNPCPPLLSNRANCHTEQRFADDLIRAHRAGQVQPGQQFNLTGTFPPCPNCHAAMRRAAAETGTKVTYNWEGPKGTHNSVTYHGDAEPKFSDTPHAQVLKNAGYNSQNDQGTFFSDDGWQRGDSTRWGYQSQQGAHQAYSNLMNTGGYR